VMAAGHGAFHRLGVPGYLMCHLSHSYHAGACLYFTFALNPPDDRDALEDYGVVKRAIQQAFVDSGATLSHHHAVGTEHAQWLEEDISAPGVAMLRALFEGTDPGANLNPGKIVAADSDRVTGETVPGSESSNSNGGAGRPRRPLDARQSSQPPS
jgi:alkyldihydroxyacetonephosphate synthase